jgi:trigger factor
LDDEFARKAAPLAGLKADEGFGLDALRAEIRRRLESAASRRVTSEYEDAVVGKVTELAEMELPDVMIERGVDARRVEYDEMFKRNGASLEQYLTEQQMTEETLRANMRPAAIESVRRELVLEAIGRAEGIAATDQEVDERIRTFAQLRNEEPASIRERLTANDGIEQLRDEITRRKVIDYLVGAQVPVAPPAEAEAAADVAPVATAQPGVEDEPAEGDPK